MVSHYGVVGASTSQQEEILETQTFTGKHLYLGTGLAMTLM